MGEGEPQNVSDFNALIELAMKAESLAHMRPVIQKELLHYDLLFALDKNGLLDNLTFQGGTSLRLCYGASRFSEDLDFVGGKDFSASQLVDMKKCIEEYVGDRYGLDVSVKDPTVQARELDSQEIKATRWRINVTTSPQRKDLPKQKIKIDVCNVPAYTRLPLALKVNYDFLPDGYSDILIMTEDLSEVMADKLVSLVNTTRYVRYRNIWDLRWLIQHGAELNTDFVAAKINDYQIEDYFTKLSSMIDSVESIIEGKPFADEMSRFLPVDVQERTLQRQKFKIFLAAEIKKLLQSLRNSLAHH